MQMVRITKILVLTMLCALFCSGCNNLPQDYECEIEGVESVQIVRIEEGFNWEENRFYDTVLQDVLDKNAFLSQLNGINTKQTYYGQAKTMKMGYIAIKINYFNGDCAYIYRNYQFYCRTASYNTNTYFIFDKEQFNDLIAAYYSTAD